MGNACRSFGFDPDDGMRIFCIAEMFVDIYHVIAANFVYRNMVHVLYTYKKIRGLTTKEQSLLVITFLFMLSLVLQAIMGFLLYVKGWKERNFLICFFWIMLAILNQTFSALIAIVEFAVSDPQNKDNKDQSTHEIYYWNMLFLYLLYSNYGIWVVRSFMDWAKENGYHWTGCNCLCSCTRNRNGSLVAPAPTTPAPGKRSSKNVAASRSAESGKLSPGGKRSSLASSSKAPTASPSIRTHKEASGKAKGGGVRGSKSHV